MNTFAFYQGRRVLVTGMTGFKGLWLATWLEALGATVHGLALPPEPEMTVGWPGLAQRFSLCIADIRDQRAVQACIEAFQPELLFHLAAQPLVRRSYAAPVLTFATNVMGTVHVLEAARKVSCLRAAVIITSDKCYENREWERGYSEHDAMGGHDPYSASKGCAELVTAAYQRSYREANPQLAIASARAGNVIGGGDWARDRIVPDIVRAILSRQPVVLRRPQARRPWLHVLEALSGYLMLGERLWSTGHGHASGWNFGPDAHDVLPVSRLTRLLLDCWGEGEIEECPHITGPHEAHTLRLDASKAQRELGWIPLLTAQTRADWTVAWYKAWRQQPQSVWDISRTQVERFQKHWQERSALGRAA
jgi:CDP-glucose 4,6-dehydratase